VCPSHNKYTRLSPRHPVTVVLLLPVHLVIALPPAPPLHGLYGHSSHRRRPSFRGALCRSIENAILLYCTHAHARAYVHTTSLAVQPRNDDVSPPPAPPPPVGYTTAVAAVFAPQTRTTTHTSLPHPPPAVTVTSVYTLLVRYPLSSTTTADVVPGRRSIYSPERGS